MKSIIVRCIRAYQYVSRNMVFSPLFLGSYSGCRSWPTCSEYAVVAVEKHGALRGGWKSFVRFLRCNPLTSHT